MFRQFLGIASLLKYRMIVIMAVIFARVLRCKTFDLLSGSLVRALEMRVCALRSNAEKNVSLRFLSIKFHPKCLDYILE